MNLKDDISLRASVLFFAVSIFCIAILGKATYEQQIRGGFWRRVFSKFSIKHNVPIEAMRGTIYSDDNKILAASMPEFDVVIDMSVAKEYVKSANVEMAKKLDTFFMKYSEINASSDNNKSWGAYKKEFVEAAKYESPRDRFYLFEENMPYEKYIAFKQFPFASDGKNKNGIIYKKTFKRIKPLPQLASIIVGKVKDDNATRGLEYSFDSVLRGITGKQTIKLLGNNASMPIDEDGEVDLTPQNGSDIHTNLNILIQEIARDELKKKLVENQSLYGCAIVMEVQTGKIKAIANAGLSRLDSSTIFSSRVYAEGEYDEYENYAMRKTEPGSTLKLVTLMNLLEDRKIDINTTVDLEGGKWIYPNAKNGDFIEDAEQHGLHQVPVETAFAASSNVGMSKLAYKFYSTNIQAYKNRLNALKLNRDSADDIEIVKPETHLRVRPNSLPDFLRSSFGYVVQTSPIRMLSIYNAIANNGAMMKPYLISAFSSEGVASKEFQPTVINQNFCSKATCSSLKKCLQSVCYSEHGTAKDKFKDLSFMVAGKTGTSYYLDKGIKLSDRIYQSSFVGYFPANSPKYSCIVVIVNRKNSPKHFGGDVAAPVFKNIANRIYSVFIHDSSAAKSQYLVSNNSSLYYNGFTGNASFIMQKVGANSQLNGARFNDIVTASYNAKTFVGVKQKIVNNAMPSLKGMSIKDAVYLCETIGLKVNVHGKGKVNKQSVAEGNKIKFGEQINLELN